MKRSIVLSAIAALALAAGASACPAAAVHPETAKLVQMGAGGLPGAKAYEAALSAAQTACTKSGSYMQVAVTFKVDAALSPGVEAKTVKVPYFVVVMYTGQIVAKEIFSVSLAFAQGTQTVSATEVVDKISLPIRRNAEPKYEILVGFQLSPEQLRAVQK